MIETLKWQVFFFVVCCTWWQQAKSDEDLDFDGKYVEDHCTDTITKGSPLNIVVGENERLHFLEAFYTTVIGDGWSYRYVPSDVKKCQGKNKCVIDKLTWPVQSVPLDGRSETIVLRYLIFKEIPELSTINKTICDQSEHHETSGVIYSPGYPNNYPDNIFCFTKIEVPDYKRIVVMIRDMDIEGKGIFWMFRSRPNDYLLMANGDYLSGELNDTVVYDDIQRSLLIRFKTDRANSLKLFRGFLLQFAVVPKTNFVKDVNGPYFVDSAHSAAKRKNVVPITTIKNGLVSPTEPSPLAMKRLRETLPISVYKPNDQHGYRLIAIISALAVLSILVLMMIYFKQRRSLNRIHQTFRNTMDEVVEYVQTTKAYGSILSNTGNNRRIPPTIPTTISYKNNNNNENEKQKTQMPAALYQYDNDYQTSPPYEYVLIRPGQQQQRDQEVSYMVRRTAPATTPISLPLSPPTVMMMMMSRGQLTDDAGTRAEQQNRDRSPPAYETIDKQDCVVTTDDQKPDKQDP